MTTKVIKILKPYPLQEEIEDDTHRFRVIACGRRWGKSLSAMREAFNMLVRGFDKTRKRQRGWIIAPTFPLVREDWIIAEELLKDAITEKKMTEMKMGFSPFGFIEFKSAEREDEGLRGAGLDFAVLDEASRISKKSWEMGIRPALSDKLGRAMFISTPKGRNWFFDMYMSGKDNSQIKSWQHPTYTNPFFPKEEWEVIKNTTPEMILRQEYLADFLEDEATVFKNLSNCFNGQIEEPQIGESYTIGLDLGKAEDFTVGVVIKNSSLGIVNIFRQNKVDWSLQKEQTRTFAFRYNNALVFIDSTGLGDPIEEDLRRSGVKTRDYKFTNETKQSLVEQLIVAIEQSLISIPNVPQTNTLIDELRSFGYEILPSGRIRYSAPEGRHDDAVIALGLAVWGVKHLLYRQKTKKAETKKGVTWGDFEQLLDEVYKNPLAKLRRPPLAI